MTDDDEFEHIVKISKRVFKLNTQHENHPYVVEFTKECNVMFVYGTNVLDGEADAKFSLGDIWNLFQEDTLPNDASNFCRQMINFMSAWNYVLKTLGSPWSIEIIKQIHKIMMEDKKVLVGKSFCTSRSY